MVNAFETSGKHWEAACFAGALGTDLLAVKGRADGSIWNRRCLESLSRLDVARSGLDQDAIDELEMNQLGKLLMLCDAEDISKYTTERKRHLYLAQSKVGRGSPADTWLLMFFGTGFMPMFNGKRDEAALATVKSLEILVAGIENGQDANTRDFCNVLLGGFLGWTLNLVLTTKGAENGFNFRLLKDYIHRAITVYDYDVHHLESINFCNNDFFLSGPGCAGVLAFHYGNLELANKSLDMSFNGLKRAANEPGVGAEALGLFLGGCGDLCLVAHFLGRSADAAQMLQDIGFDFERMDDKLQAAAKSQPNMFRPIGSKVKGEFLGTSEGFLTCGKMLYALNVSWRAVSKAAVLREMPSPDEVQEAFMSLEVSNSVPSLGLVAFTRARPCV